MFSKKVFLLHGIVSLLGASLCLQAAMDYRIGPEDVLQISVYEEADLSLEVRVSAQGYITYPLLNQIKVGGLTVRELEEKLTHLLAQDYLVNPQVTVFVKEYSNVYVIGEVDKSGSYKLEPHTTLLTALATAGGFSEFANRNEVLVIRKEKGKKKIIHISLSEIEARSLKEKDIVLKPNDVVQVMRNENIYVLGQVNKPGEFVLKGKLTVVEAISLAGGLTKIAAPNKTRVIRTVDGAQNVLEVPVADILKTGDKSKDIPLESDDVVMVPESFF